MSNERLSLKCRSCECRISQAWADAGAALVEGMGCETMCEDCARKMAASSETDRATPRPWRVDGGTTPQGDLFVHVDDGSIAGRTCIATVHGRIAEGAAANAALIVRAVNAHDALVEACEAASAIMSHAPGCVGDPLPCAGCKCVDRLDAALALARGEVKP